MDKILNNWNNFLNEQTEPFQKKVKQGYVKDRNQYLKGGKGKPSKPFDVEPSSTRAKSAPPIGESSIEEVWTNIDPELLEINDNNLDETIVKKGSQYCLKSKKSGKNLGCYANKAGAKKREKQVQYFKHMKESYELDEGLFDDLMVKMGMSKEQEKKKEYTNYNEVYNNIYVGAAPIKGGKLIHSLLEQQEFMKIFIMSNESANIIKRQYKDERNIPPEIVLDYAVEDTENPTQEEIQKLNKAGLLIKGYARQGKVLVTCNRGLNRSATAACIAMTLFGIEPEEAIRKVQSARGQQALTLNNKPHQGFMPIILGSKET